MVRSIKHVLPLVDLFEAHRSEANAAPMKRYMREQFEFLGIKTPARRALLREYLAEHRAAVSNQLQSIVKSLWTLPYREYQYAAVDLLQRFDKKLTAQDLALAEQLITKKSWWDTVDALASRTVGGILRREPASRNAVISVWRHSDNLWLRRTTLLFQLTYKAETDSSLLFSIINDNLDSSEFFLQKAIGWALREYSKTDARAVRDFVEKTALAPLSEREALKWLRSGSAR